MRRPDPVSHSDGSTTYTNQYRIIVKRTPERRGLSRRWRWSVEESEFGGGWTSVDAGNAVTRSGALERAQGVALKFSSVKKIEMLLTYQWTSQPSSKKEGPEPIEAEIIE